MQYLRWTKNTQVQNSLSMLAHPSASLRWLIIEMSAVRWEKRWREGEEENENIQMELKMEKENEMRERVWTDVEIRKEIESESE